MENKSKLTGEDILLLTGLRNLLGHIVSLDGKNGVVSRMAKVYGDTEDGDDESYDHERLKLDELMESIQEAQEAIAYLIPKEDK